MSSTRQRRVQELLVHEISEIVSREVRDPRVGFVTITGAEVSADLRHACVYYSVLGDAAAREGTAQALRRAAGFIRAEFARRVQLRFVPELRFAFDASAERGERLSRLLESVREEAPAPATEAAPPSTAEEPGPPDGG
jgi:ribosome-binding factor A